MAPEQQGLGLEPTEVWQIVLNLPWPPSVNHYFMEYAMPPAVAKMQERLDEEGWSGFHQWLRKNTRTMKRVGEKGHAYRADVLEIVLQHRLNKGVRVPVLMKVRAYPPDKRERDLSNLYKCLEDALEHAAVVESDYLIAAHDSQRMDYEIVKGGRVVVTLSPLVY